MDFVCRSFYPVLLPKKVNGKEEPIPETCSCCISSDFVDASRSYVLCIAVGVVRLTIHQAKDLDHTKSLSGELNPLARVILGSSPHVHHSTPRRKHTNNPVWESATEFLCTDRASSVITINVVDDRDFLGDPTLGLLRVKLDDLLEATKEVGKDWWPLSGCNTGRLRLSTEWKPLNMAGSLQGADKFVPPIGIVRLW